ncbi:MAG: hypothetical protein P8N48_00365, partial [Bacteroidales bacterium]|nr:hypothetical protein [Bacteroidales bacterium]
MKYVYLLITLLAFSLSGLSQIYVGDVNINKKQDLEFVEIIGNTKNFKIKVHIDYGQLNPKTEEIRDKSGTIARSNNI